VEARLELLELTLQLGDLGAELVALALGIPPPLTLLLQVTQDPLLAVRIVLALRAALPGGRTVVGDEPAELVEAARVLDREVRVAGWSERADEALRPRGVEADHWGVHRFRWQEVPVTLALPGRHAVSNALLALAVAELLGVSPRAAARGLAGVEAVGMRGQHRRIGDLTVLVDCYNANPPSVRAALDLLEAHEAGRKVAVLGTMLELGESGQALEQFIAARGFARCQTRQQDSNAGIARALQAR